MRIRRKLGRRDFSSNELIVLSRYAMAIAPFVIAFVCLLVVACSASARNLPATSPATPVNVMSVVLQNEKSRDAILTATYKFQTKTEASLKGLTSDTTGQAAVEGEWIWKDEQGVAKFGPNGQALQRDEVAFVGPHAFGFWHRGNPNAYEYRHRSAQQMSEKAKGLADGMFAGTKLLNYAFGIRGRSLREVVGFRPDENRWIAKEVTISAGRVVYELLRFERAGNGAENLVEAIELDPRKGYLISRISRYAAGGAMVAECKLDLAQIDDQWFPVHVVEDHFSGIVGDVRPSYHVSIQISDAKINQLVPDSRFSTEALKLPPNVKRYIVSDDGTIVEPPALP